MMTPPIKWRRVLIQVLVTAALFGGGIILEDVLEDNFPYIHIRFILLSIALAGSLGFVGYFTRSNWRSSEATRSMMRVMVCMVLILSYVLVGNLLPDYHGEHTVGVILFAWLGYSNWRMFIHLRTAQIRAAKLLIPTK
jgi:uncharacterized membrane protein YeiH